MALLSAESQMSQQASAGLIDYPPPQVRGFNQSQKSTWRCIKMDKRKVSQTVKEASESLEILHEKWAKNSYSEQWTERLHNSLKVLQRIRLGVADKEEATEMYLFARAMRNKEGITDTTDKDYETLMNECMSIRDGTQQTTLEVFE